MSSEAHQPQIRTAPIALRNFFKNKVMAKTILSIPWCVNFLLRCAAYLIVGFMAIATKSAVAATWFGTAFAIGDGYTFVTNEHVVDGSKTICLRSPSGTRSQARIIAVDKHDDLAIIRTSIYAKPLPLANSDEIKKGMTVYALGYPVPTIMGFELKFTEGIINSLTGVGGDRRRVQISAGVQPGNSGGPLISEQGNVVGIIDSGLGKKFTEATGHVASGVGYAVNIARLRALVDTTQPLPQYMTAQPSRVVSQRTKIANQSEGSVFMVVASDSIIKCSDTVDLPIPEFGEKPKSKAELEREAREISRAAALRIEREDSERRAAEEAALRRREAAAQAERESRERLNIPRNAIFMDISEAIKKIHPEYEKIINSPGFIFHSHFAGIDLENLGSQGSEASTVIEEFAKYVKLYSQPDAAANDIAKLFKGDSEKLTSLPLIYPSHGFLIISRRVKPGAELTLAIRRAVDNKWIVLKQGKSDGMRTSFLLPDKVHMTDFEFYSWIFEK